MSKIDWAQSKTNSESYQTNLETAKKFISNVKKSLLNGMSVYVADSHHLPESLFMIAWRPPINEKIGSMACPINLNQNSADFKNELEKEYNKIYTFAKKILFKD